MENQQPQQDKKEVERGVIKDIENIEKEIKAIPHWFNFLVYGGQLILIIAVGLLFGITASAIVILALSAFFAGYLAVAFTTSFRIAQFAKSISISLGITGIVLLFIFEGWWGIGGIVGYWILIGLSMAFWKKHTSFRIYE